MPAVRIFSIGTVLVPWYLRYLEGTEGTSAALPRHPDPRWNCFKLDFSSFHYYSNNLFLVSRAFGVTEGTFLPGTFGRYLRYLYYLEGTFGTLVGTLVPGMICSTWGGNEYTSNIEYQKKRRKKRDQSLAKKSKGRVSMSPNLCFVAPKRKIYIRYRRYDNDAGGLSRLPVGALKSALCTVNPSP